MPDGVIAAAFTVSDVTPSDNPCATHVVPSFTKIAFGLPGTFTKLVGFDVKPSVTLAMSLGTILIPISKPKSVNSNFQCFLIKATTFFMLLSAFLRL